MLRDHIKNRHHLRLSCTRFGCDHIELKSAAAWADLAGGDQITASELAASAICKICKHKGASITVVPECTLNISAQYPSVT